jgi:hypothetical protein
MIARTDPIPDTQAIPQTIEAIASPFLVGFGIDCGGSVPGGERMVWAVHMDPSQYLSGLGALGSGYQPGGWAIDTPQIIAE